MKGNRKKSLKSRRRIIQLHIFRVGHRLLKALGWVIKNYFPCASHLVT